MTNSVMGAGAERLLLFLFGCHAMKFNIAYVETDVPGMHDAFKAETK